MSVRESGLVLGDVTGVFLTHLHADHVVGLPDFWLAGHHRGPFGRRATPLTVVGPVGTARMLTGLQDAYRDVRGYWRLTEPDTDFVIREFSDEGVVFEDGGLTVTAFHVSHARGSGIDPYGALSAAAVANIVFFGLALWLLLVSYGEEETAAYGLIAILFLYG